jgi:hypothetical protein
MEKRPRDISSEAVLLSLAETLAYTGSGFRSVNCSWCQ